MPFPLIAIATIGAIGASLGLQAFDTYNKPITVTTYTTKQPMQTYNAKPTTPKAKSADSLPLVVIIGGALLVTAVLLK